MQLWDLSLYGYEGYYLREDRVIITPKGREVHGNQNGQVRLIGPDKKPVWRSITKLYYAVKPNPIIGTLEVKPILGYDNFFVREDGYIFEEMFDGIEQKCHLHNGSVKLRNAKGEAEWVRAHILVAWAFLPNPLNRHYVGYLTTNKKDLHYSNLIWSSARTGYTKDDLIIHLWLKGRSISEICWDTDMREEYVKMVLDSNGV